MCDVVFGVESCFDSTRLFNGIVYYNINLLTDHLCSIKGCINTQALCKHFQTPCVCVQVIYHTCV